ncbi:hypothetical protein HDE_04629 [Halotydeus destructor]|nr:hypothetical protein HDE_04629 [Halotydeus destructor]
MIFPVVLVVVGLSLATSGERLNFSCGPMSAEQDKLVACVLKTMAKPFDGIMKTCVMAAGQADLSPKTWQTVMCKDESAPKFRDCLQSKLESAKATQADMEKAMMAAEPTCNKAQG